MTTFATQYACEWFGGVGRGAILCRDIVSSLFRAKVQWRDVLCQMYLIGVESQSVVTITGAFTGMVLCAQTGAQFHKVKMDTSRNSRARSPLQLTKAAAGACGSVRFGDLSAYLRRRNSQADAPITPRAIAPGSGTGTGTVKSKDSKPLPSNDGGGSRSVGSVIPDETPSLPAGTPAAIAAA